MSDPRQIVARCISLASAGRWEGPVFRALSDGKIGFCYNPAFLTCKVDELYQLGLSPQASTEYPTNRYWVGELQAHLQRSTL